MSKINDRIQSTLNQAKSPGTKAAKNNGGQKVKKTAPAPAPAPEAEDDEKSKNSYSRVHVYMDPDLYKQLSRVLFEIEMEEGKSQKRLSFSVMLDAAVQMLLECSPEDRREKIRAFERQGK